MFRRLLSSAFLFTFFAFTFNRCAYNDLSEIAADCSTSNLELTLISKSDVTTCKSIDGSLTVEASGGTAPYDFNLNGAQYQTNNVFIDLGPGTYLVTVKDKNNCEKTLEVTINAANSTLAATATTVADSGCTTDNGSINVTATGGNSPYQYQIDSKGYGSSGSFSNLKDGQHTIIVKDANDCQHSLTVDVPRGDTGISYANVIKDILDTNCNFAGCHGTGTGTRNWTNINNLKPNALNIKMRTSNKTMPPGNPLAQDLIDKIACWADDGAPTNN